MVVPLLKPYLSAKQILRYIGETNVMQKLDGINVIIQLKVQSHRKFFKATSTAALHVLQNFKCSKKCRDQEEL